LGALREKARGRLTTGLLTDESFKRLYQDPEVQAAMAVFVGIPREAAEHALTRKSGISEKFLCPLPGHDERRPSADAVYFSRKIRTLQLRCHHWESKPINLPTVYAMRLLGKPVQLSKAELKLWTLRMLVDMEVLDPVDVERRLLPDELPEGAPEHLREVYHAIVQVLSLRYLFGREPAPLTHKFLARWSGLSEYAVSKCMRWLLKHFYLQGGVFLRKDGTLSKTREEKMQPECFVMGLAAKAWRPKGKTFVQRSRVEWAKYFAEKREQEALEELDRIAYFAWQDEHGDEIQEAIDEYNYEVAWRRGDFDDHQGDDYEEPEPNADEVVDGDLDEEEEEVSV
jgi:hypothetical protein